MGNAVKEDTSYAEQFSQFLRFLRQCQEDLSIAESLQDDTEAETQDILHELELKENTYHEYARLSKALKRFALNGEKLKIQLNN